MQTRSTTQPNKSTSNSKSINFALIDQIERGLRKLKRNEKKENSSETTITPKSSASASEIIEMTTKQNGPYMRPSCVYFICFYYWQ